MNKKIIFNIFRYQILPQNRIEFSLFDDITSVDELIERKNLIFGSILSELEGRDLKYKNTPVKLQLKYCANDFFVFKMGIKRSTKIGNEDLEDTKQDDWRYIFVIFWNKSDKQFLLIQEKSKVFDRPKTALKTIEELVQQSLSDRYLIIKLQSLFDRNEFWEIIKNYHRKISSINFVLITPNMANISGALSQDLKALFKSTNSVENTLKISAAQESNLHLEQNNEFVRSIVEYASEGGGSAQIKIKGIKKTMSTADKYKSIEIDEIAISNPTQETVEAIGHMLDNCVRV